MPNAATRAVSNWRRHTTLLIASDKVFFDGFRRPFTAAIPLPPSSDPLDREKPNTDRQEHADRRPVCVIPIPGDGSKNRHERNSYDRDHRKQELANKDGIWSVGHT